MSSPSHQDPGSEEPSSFSSEKSLGAKIKKAVVGAPRDLHDKSIFHRMSLVAVLAWVGLGADGLSSSAYGPDESFRALGEHTYLAVALALATVLTVTVISIAYSRIIEHFPYGGGGYVVASHLLGPGLGVISGSALLIDYVLTISVSIACCADQVFSLLPLTLHGYKVIVEGGIIGLMILLNLRGIKESILILAPIFFLFVITHAILIAGGIGTHLGEVPRVAGELRTGFREGLSSVGFAGMFAIFLRAYSMGGGTYTGIEAVSNGLQTMREPRVRTGKRTMTYMAVSLAITASGILICYLLFHISPQTGKTMNAVLLERFADNWRLGTLPVGRGFVVLALAAEAALLFVAAQAGFIDGPRVMANMALDGWLPRRYALLSARLTMQNGVLFMGGAALVTLLYAHGNITTLVVMYSLNVFLTFSLSEIGMCRFWIKERRTHANWKTQLPIHVIGLTMCGAILVTMIVEKFRQGAWVTLLVTAMLVSLCFLIRRHYRLVGRKLAEVYRQLEEIPESQGPPPGEVDPQQPTAAVLVANYSGLGIHTVLNVFRQFPGLYKNLVFVSVGVVDSGEFKGEGAIEALRGRTEKTLNQYLDLARKIGVPAASRYALGTDAVEEAEKLCLQVAREFPRAVFFAGKLVFQREKWYQQLLHNETAFDLLKRLNEAGRTLVVLPARVEAGPRPRPV